MGRKTHPRSEKQHAVVASQIIAQHERRTGKAVKLPVPIDMIVEGTFGLTVLWDEIPEEPGGMILGMLLPADRQIVMNASHEALFESVIGPERFTLAHELGHWVYDAENPDQLSFDLTEGSSQKFCRDKGDPSLSRDAQLREVNANKLAAHLLMPEHLLCEADIDGVVSDIKRAARSWGVSVRALRIQLETLGLIDDLDVACLDFEG